MFLEGNPPLTIPLTLDLDRKARTGVVDLDGEKVDLKDGQLSDWVTLTFKAASASRSRGSAE